MLYPDVETIGHTGATALAEGLQNHPKLDLQYRKTADLDIAALALAAKQYCRGLRIVHR